MENIQCFNLHLHNYPLNSDPDNLSELGVPWLLGLAGLRILICVTSPISGRCGDGG